MYLKLGCNNFSVVWLVLGLNLFLGVLADRGFAELPTLLIRKYSFRPQVDIDQAEIYFASPVRNPKGILVVCPAMQNAKRSEAQENWAAFAERFKLGVVALSVVPDQQQIFRQEEWVKFAAENELAIVSVSFLSKQYYFDCGQGYVNPDRGSGEMLEYVLDKTYGKEVPVLLYGFGQGAEFAANLLPRFKHRVKASCLVSPSRIPGFPIPGESKGLLISAVGEGLPAIRKWYEDARSQGVLWTWLNLNDRRMFLSQSTDRFVRKHFDSVLNGRDSFSAYFDASTAKKVSITDLRAHPERTVWLPSESLRNEWATLHRASSEMSAYSRLKRRE